MSEDQSKASHTPGPWEFDPDNFGRPWNPGYGLLDSHGSTLGVSVSHPIGRDDDGELEANAHLIAAAPDLLASLIEFVQCNDGEHTIEMYHRARAAIARAEGRSRDDH